MRVGMHKRIELFEALYGGNEARRARTGACGGD